MKKFDFVSSFLFVLFVSRDFPCDATETNIKFPPSFKFGAASSSYQIEGGWNADGKTPSIWDTFTHNFPKAIADGENGDVSADSYHLFKNDIKALKEVGVTEHKKFSISWPRVLSGGFIVNPKGIDYYNALIDELIANNIEPIVTMYHFDLPQHIQDIGGLTNPLFVDYFKFYAEVLFKNFGDRVKTWITFNEPYNFCVHGYATGIIAPGIKAEGYAEYLCAHHVLEAHAVTYHLYKQKFFDDQKGKIGISLNSRYFYPFDETVDEEFCDQTQDFWMGWFANPIFSTDGDYPKMMIDKMRSNGSDQLPFSRLPTFSNSVKKDLIGSADFFALNYYTSRLIKPKMETPSNPPSFEDFVGADYFIDKNWKRAKSEWLFSVPEGLRDLLNWIKRKYNSPEIIITENGFSDSGEIEDNDRILYFKTHIEAVMKAIEDGCNITGYTAWSIIDNFEWHMGYTEKFGIYAVNMTSPLKLRSKKKSANFLKKLIEDNSSEV